MNRSPLPDRPSIAVLPFDNLSGQPEETYFSDGITEDIITGLARFRSLFVIARNSSFAFRGKSIDLTEIGRKLGVSFILEGSVRRAGQRVRITAQLIEAASGAHLWAERYDRGLDDIFAVQDEVAQMIVSRALRPDSRSRFPAVRAHADRKSYSPRLPAAWPGLLQGLRQTTTTRMLSRCSKGRSRSTPAMLCRIPTSHLCASRCTVLPPRPPGVGRGIGGGLARCRSRPPREPLSSDSLDSLPLSSGLRHSGAPS